MAIAATMSLTTTNNSNSTNNTAATAVATTTKDDDHEHDMVMPGFRFHPTEEELVEFYLRRKVEGKRFNVELITFLDLYRYDPWELPALAAIGEKEWFFYVPRDRKYRNGDRPNRVTTSGYWKATGADRMIRTENSRSIGLKKTLVFYSGKAPKGIRTSWIMNEYRLPQHETERYQKAEISLCRVYKRAGVEDHPSLPRALPSRASSSRGTQSDKKQHQISIERFQSQQIEMEKMSETDGSSSSDVTTTLVLSKTNNNAYNPHIVPAISTSLGLPATMEEEEEIFLNQSRQACSLLSNNTNLFAASSNPVDDLHRLVNYQQACITHHNQQQQQQQQQPPYYTSHQHQHSSQFSIIAPPQSQVAPALPLNMLPNQLPAAFSERLWEWNPITEANRDFNVNNPFNVDVVFSGESCADAWIEKEVVALREDGCPKVWVVTSDHMQQHAAHGAGAFVWSCKALVSEIKASHKEMERMLQEQRTSFQGRLLKHNLDSEVVDALKDLRNKLAENESKSRM